MKVRLNWSDVCVIRMDELFVSCSHPFEVFLCQSYFAGIGYARMVNDKTADVFACADTESSVSAESLGKPKIELQNPIKIRIHLKSIILLQLHTYD